MLRFTIAHMSRGACAPALTKALPSVDPRAGVETDRTSKVAQPEKGA